MQGENEIRVDTVDGVTVLDIRGDVTVLSEPFLKEAYETANSQGATRILLKFDENAYINSGGIAVLIQLLSQTKKNNQQIAMTGLSDHFRKIFGMVGITKFGKICASQEEAVKHLSQA